MLSYIVDRPCFYWSVAVLLAALWGVRGIYWQKHKEDMNLTAKIFLYYGHDAVYNFVSAIAGFTSLKVAVFIFRSITDFSNIAISTTALLVFLILFSVLGIAGVLPRFFYRGAFIGNNTGKNRVSDH